MVWSTKSKFLSVIKRVPTTLITKGGQEVFRKVGSFNVKELTAMVKQA